MFPTNGVILTSAGSLLISKSLELVKPLEITHMKIGTGDINSLEQARALTDLVNSYININMSTLVRSGDLIRVRGSYTNEEFIKEINIKEIGVFAKIGDETPVLFGYVNDGQGEIIPPGNTGNIISRTRDLYIGITGKAEVVITIDKSLVYATIEDLNEILSLKEDKFKKNSGFNKNKSDSTNLDDSNTVATSAAVNKTMKKATEASNIAAGKEPAFSKKTGFNLDKTDLTENDSNKIFTAKGALNLFNNLTTIFTNAINKAKEALRVDISRKEDKFPKNSGFNKVKTDIVENDPNKIFTALGALNLKNWLVSNYTGLMNNIREVLDTKILSKLPHGGYSGTGQDLKNLVDNALNKTTKIYNYFEELGKNQNTPLLEVIQAMANDSILKTPTDIKCTADYPSDKQGTLLIVKNNDYRVLISWQDIRGDLYTRSYTQNNVGDTWYKQWSSNNFNPDSKFDIYQKRVILDSTKNKKGLDYFTNNGQIGTGAGYFPSNYCQVWNLGTDSNYYGMQIAGSFSPNDPRIWMRSTTDNPSANTDYPGEYYGKWAKMYSDLDKPSLSDLGVKVEDVAINVTRATLDFKAYDYFVIQALYLGNTSVVIGSATVFENDVEASTVGIESSRAYISVNYGIVRDTSSRVSTINFRTATGQSSTFSVKGVKIR